MEVGTDARTRRVGRRRKMGRMKDSINPSNVDVRHRWGGGMEKGHCGISYFVKLNRENSRDAGREFCGIPRDHFPLRHRRSLPTRTPRSCSTFASSITPLSLSLSCILVSRVNPASLNRAMGATRIISIHFSHFVRLSIRM